MVKKRQPYYPGDGDRGAGHRRRIGEWLLAGGSTLPGYDDWPRRTLGGRAAAAAGP
ncbi:hypothetical protein ACKI2N_004390 [Cupriavidus sp. 30B13]|uniref:hypothetical protein n=1 Tax=Cupriavidus sp. 30B13 TaxID=3384241 RepID=UPI003B8F66BA